MGVSEVKEVVVDYIYLSEEELNHYLAEIKRDELGEPSAQESG